MKKAKKAKKPSKKKVLKTGEKSTRIRYWDNNVPDDFAFYVCDGTVIKNLKEMSRMLNKMSDDVFYYHANPEKNDFSSWIKDVIDCNDLAHNMLGKGRIESRETIMIYMKKKTGKKPKS